MTKVTKEEFFYFIKISKKELYENRSTWKNATRRYVDLFARHSNNNVFISFNLWAFLFRETWFVYRKMYLKALLLPLLIFLLPLMSLSFLISSSQIREIEKIFSNSCAILLYILLVCTPFVLSGLFGNYIYVNWVKSKIIKIKAKKKIINYIDQNQSKATTWIGAILSLLVLPIVIIAVYGLIVIGSSNISKLIR